MLVNNIVYGKLIQGTLSMEEQQLFALQLKSDNEKETEIYILLKRAVEILFSVISALTQPHTESYFGRSVALIKHTSALLLVSKCSHQ